MSIQRKPGFHQLLILFILTVCCTFYLELPSASAKESDEVSALPYLKRQGRERIQPGILNLYLTPENAIVYLDGKPLESPGQGVIVRREGNGKFILENLIPGTHVLKMTKTGYSPKLKYLLIEPGSLKSVEMELSHKRWRFFVGEMVLMAILTISVTGIYIIAG